MQHHEFLELRQLLSAALSGDVLLIKGTSHSDSITVNSKDGGVTLRVVVNGVLSTFPSSAVREIQIYGYRGNDSLKMSNAVLNPALIVGDKGHDTIWGGGGNDSLY